MARAPYRVFISRVSTEFGLVSTAIASDLRARGIEVKVQEDFTQGHTAETWLGRLEEYIRDCQAVICIHGQRSGGFPGARAIEPYLSLRPPELSRISYTQWEYFFTLHHGKKPLIYIADPAWSPDKPASTGEDPVSQQAFLDYLRNPADRTSQPFDSAETLRILVLREKWPDHPVSKPSNLPGGYIGRTFLGRDEFLTTLRESLLGTSHATAITQKSAATGISGLGGIGKTHAAVEYAHRHRDDYTALLFASSDTPEKLSFSLANLCGVLYPDEIDNLPLEEPARMRATLRWLTGNRDWLLIIDNVDDELAAKAVQEILGQLISGHVLITSRLQGWSDQVKNIDLEVLSETSSAELILNLTNNRRRLASGDQEQARKLAQFLEGLPLAIHQAAGYINEQTLTLGQYITRYETEAADLLNWFNDLSIPYERPEKLAPKPVLVTWKASFDKLSEIDQMWLSVFSIFAPDPIPEFLVETHENTTFDQKLLLRQASDSIATAAKYCLLTRPGTQSNFKIHRLVQQITRFQLVDEDVTVALELAISLLAMAEPGDPTDIRSFPKWNSLRPHALLLSQQASDDTGLTNLEWLVSEIGLLAQSKGSYSDAEKHFRRALRIYRESCDADDPLLAIACMNLGSLLQVTNQMSEAESLIREALLIDREAFGDRSEMVTRDLNNLARLLQDTGRHDEAEPMMREILEIDRTIFGPDDPILATNLNNLAGLLQQLGRLDEAEPLMRQSLAIDLEAFGGDHPSVARDLNNLATLLHDKKNTIEAEPMARESLRIERAVFGDNHPNVAQRCGNLASLLVNTYRFSEAEPLMWDALRITRDAFGHDHPDVALHLNNLGLLLASTNRLPEAKEMLREALSDLGG